MITGAIGNVFTVIETGATEVALHPEGSETLTEYEPVLVARNWLDVAPLIAVPFRFH